MNTLKTQFDNCEQFAAYIFDSLLKEGDKVTLEFNKITNLDIPTGRSLDQWVRDNITKGYNFEKFGTTKSFLYDIYELTKSPLFKHYESARRAYSWSSMNPERSAKINLNGHIAELTSDLNDIPEEDHVWYTEKYVNYYLTYLSAKGRTASSMVTGSSKFPTERNRKALDSEHNKYEAFQNWREKAKKAIVKRIKRNKPEDQKQNEDWQSLKNQIIKKATVIVGIDNQTEPYSRPLFVSSIVGLIERQAKNGKKDLVNKALDLLDEINKLHKKPIITQRNSVWKLKEVVSEAAKVIENPKQQEIYPIEDGKVIVNFEEDRIQVQHDNKPAREIIDMLKKNAFNWSRFNSCWQRKITNNTKYAIKQMFDIAIK